MQEVNRYFTGQEFGDLALSDPGKNGLRGATVVALKDTHFMVLNREPYERIIGEEKNRRNSSLVAMIKDLYCFKDTHYKIILSFMIYKQIEHYRFGRTVFDWEKPVDKMFLVLKGQVTLVRKKPKQLNRLDDFKQFFIRRNGSFQNEVEIEQRHPLICKAYKADTTLDEICIREVGQCFGEEMLVSRNNSDYRVVSSCEETVLAVLTGEDYRKKLFHYMPSCRVEFERLVVERYSFGYPWKKEPEPVSNKEEDKTRLAEAAGKNPQSQVREEDYENYMQILAICKSSHISEKSKISENMNNAGLLQ